MTEDKILRTAQYVEGDLDETEKAAFEVALAEDEVLKKHLADYKNIHQSLQIEFGDDANRDLLLNTMHKLSNEHFGREKSAPKVLKLNGHWKWMSAVAAVLVLSLFIWEPWQGNLYQQYNSDVVMSVTERGADKTDLDEAAGLFNDNKYADANVILAKLHATEPNNAMVSYYYGLTLMEINELPKSRTVLNELYDGESVYRYDAAYKIAMGFLKEDKTADAKVWLQKIPKHSEHYAEAVTLLKKL